MKKIIKAGATDQTLDIFIQDSSSTTGGGLTGLAYNTASLVCYYRKGATGSATALSLATQTVGGAHSDGGFVEISSANMPGVYRLDLSDTIVDTAGSVSLMLKGAANMAPLTIELQVSAVNLEDSVRFGMTALPNAAADAAGGLPISDAGGLDLDALRSDVAAVLVDTGTTLDGKIDTIDGIVDAILLDTAEIGAAGAGLTVLATAADLATVDTVVDAIKLKTDNLPADPADQSAVESAITAATSGLATAANLATVAGYLDTEIAAILEDTGTTIPATLAGLATQASVDVIDGIVDSILVDTGTDIPNLINTVDTVVDAIKVKTDQFVFTVANQVDANALSGGGGLDAAGIRAAVGLASANLDTQLGTIDTVVDRIEVDTQDIQSRLPAALVGGRIDANTGAISADSTAADNLEAMLDGTGGVVLSLSQLAIVATDGNPNVLLGGSGAGDGFGFSRSGAGNAFDSEFIGQISSAVAAELVTYDAATGAEIATVANYLDTEIAAILEDTGTTIPAQIAALTIPSAATIADAVWDEVTSGHVTAGTTGAAIVAAGAAGDPWGTALPGAYAAGTAGYKLGNLVVAGSGAITFTYTVTTDGSTPIPDVDVWVTSDSAGTQILASGRTNQSGVATFYLDAGTVYIWCQKSGYNFSNPDTEVVA